MTRFLLRTLLLTLICLPVSAVEPSTLQLFTLDNFKPYSWCDNGIPRGIDTEILQSALESADINYQIQCRPWSRAIELTKISDNGIFSAFKTPERELNMVFVPTPLHFSTFSLFIRKSDKSRIHSITDLYGMRIGINRGFSVSKAFDQAAAMGFITTETVSNTEQNIGKLFKGRLDGFVNNREVTLCQAHRMGVSDQLAEVNLIEHHSRPAYLALSKATPEPKKKEWVERINNELQALFRSGSIRKIHAKYTNYDAYCARK